MTEQEAGELPELTSLSLSGLLALVVTACFFFASHLLPPSRDSSCRDSKVPLKVASYGNTWVIIFPQLQHYSLTARQAGWRLRRDALGADILDLCDNFQVIELVQCSLGC